MAEILTISQLNKIGERLRKNIGTEEDLRILDEFRVSFEPAYQEVFAALVSMGHNPGGRPQKTTQSISPSWSGNEPDYRGCRTLLAAESRLRT